MSALVVVESHFGNTLQIAEAISDGLGGAPVVTVDKAPATIPDDVHLLLLGGPTHAFSMTRPQTRADAGQKGGHGSRTGIREWIQILEPHADLQVITFDTHIDKKWVPGSAAKSAASALKARGIRGARYGKTFYVSDIGGPLLADEIERARNWGEQLAG